MPHQVSAPLVVTKNEDGSALYLYAGAILPERVKGAELDRLVAEGFVVDLTPVEPESVRPTEAGPGSAKDKWVEFAAVKGVEIDPESPKDDIIAAVTAAGF